MLKNLNYGGFFIKIKNVKAREVIDMATFVGNYSVLYGEIRSLDDILAKIRNVKIDVVIAVADCLNENNLYKYWIE